MDIWADLDEQYPDQISTGEMIILEVIRKLSPEQVHLSFSSIAEKMQLLMKQNFLVLMSTVVKTFGVVTWNFIASVATFNFTNNECNVEMTETKFRFGYLKF